MQLNGVPSTTYLAMRYGGHISAALWIASASWQIKGAIRITGLLLALDLTVYSGKTIRLRFRYFQGASDFVFFLQYGWYIDDISIVNESWTDVANTAVTSFTDHKPSGSYCYQVRTTYLLGTDLVPSLFSNVVNVNVAPGIHSSSHPQPSNRHLGLGPPSSSVQETGVQITVEKQLQADGSVTIQPRTA